MNILLAKTLSPKTITDKEVEEKTGTTSFISFETAIESSLIRDGQVKNPIGFKVTEQGIILIWD